MTTLRSSMAAMLAVLGAGAACTAAPAAPPPPAQTFSIAMDGIPYVRDAEGGWYVVDTGAPRTVVTPDAAGAPASFRGERSLPDWHFGLNPGNVPVLVTTAAAGSIAFPRLPFRGVLGVDLLQHFTLTMDPRAGSLVAAAPPLERSAEAAWLAVERVGAGTLCLDDGQCASYGPSRLVVRVLVEGVEATALLDTGSQNTRITESLLRRLPSRTGRPILRLPGDTVRLTRAAAFEVVAPGNVSTRIANGVVSVADDEDFFAKLRVETARPIEILLGQSYLASFVLQVDLATPAISLRPYEGPPLFDDLDGGEISIGAALGLRDGCFSVVGIFPGHDADAKGLRAGDCITTVDALSRKATTLTQLQAYFRERGAGARVHLAGQRGQQPLDMTVLVEDLLPPIATN